MQLRNPWPKRWTHLRHEELDARGHEQHVQELGLGAAEEVAELDGPHVQVPATVDDTLGDGQGVRQGRRHGEWAGSEAWGTAGGR